MSLVQRLHPASKTAVVMGSSHLALVHSSMAICLVIPMHGILRYVGIEECGHCYRDVVVQRCSKLHGCQREELF